MKKAILFDAFNQTAIVATENHREILSTICDVLNNDFDFVFYICDKDIKIPFVESSKIAYGLVTSGEDYLAIMSSISQYYQIVLAIHCDDNKYTGRYTESVTEIEKLINSKRFLCLSKRNKRYELLKLG